MNGPAKEFRGQFLSMMNKRAESSLRSINKEKKRWHESRNSSMKIHKMPVNNANFLAVQ